MITSANMVLNWINDTSFGFIMMWVVGSLALVSLYMLPTFLVWRCQCKHVRVIFWLNILTGWTVIFWITILLWPNLCKVFDDDRNFPQRKFDKT